HAVDRLRAERFFRDVGVGGMSSPALSSGIGRGAVCVRSLVRARGQLVSDPLVRIENVASAGNGVVDENQGFWRAAGREGTDRGGSGFFAGASLSIAVDGALNLLRNLRAIREGSVGFADGGRGERRARNDL